MIGRISGVWSNIKISINGLLMIQRDSGERWLGSWIGIRDGIKYLLRISRRASMSGLWVVNSMFATIAWIGMLGHGEGIRQH